MTTQDLLKVIQNMVFPLEQYLTVQQVIDYSKELDFPLSHDTIRKWAQNGTLGEHGAYKIGVGRKSQWLIHAPTFKDHVISLKKSGYIKPGPKVD